MVCLSRNELGAMKICSVGERLQTFLTTFNMTFEDMNNVELEARAP